MDSKEKININNLILAIYLTIPMITRIVTTFLPIENNILILVILLLIVFVSYNIKKIIITKKFIIINLVIFLTFLISFIMVTDNKYTIDYLLSYFLYGTIGMFFIQYSYEYKKVFQYINIVFVIFTVILVYRYIPLVKTSDNLDFTMDLSYALMTGVTATLINFKYNKGKIIKIISILCLLISFYYLIILNNNRGSILMMLLFIGLCVLRKIKNKRNRFIILSIGIVVCFISFNIVLNYLGNIDTNINWINRLQLQMERDNITSDRDSLYIDAFNEINEHLFTGIGIGEYENKHAGLYTHNIFLQLACENGIMWAILVGGYIIFCIYKTIFETNDTEENIFLLFLLVQFIPRLLVSSVQWINSYIWIYLYIYIRGRNKKISIKN